jgi:hypothetical protein
MRKTIFLITVVCAFVAVSREIFSRPAAAAGLPPILADCNTHARLTVHYSIPQLRNALATMPAEIQEYSDCPDVIQRALLAEVATLRGDGGLGSGGGSFFPTPLIVVLTVLVVGGAGFTGFAWRRRGLSG